MKIKQQKKIQAFLIETCGADKGNKVFDRQRKALRALLKTTENKSKAQRKTLAQTILPRIALYQALSKSFSADAAYEFLRSYMLDIVAAEKHASMRKMERVPCFYALYSRIFLRIMRSTDLQESTQKRGRNFFNITITKCLWHTACMENGCAKLCRLFCDVDDVTYGGLQKIGFTRTQTLGYGGDCCDFHFFRKR